jgi:DNA-binding MarR family transcriptional regulator
MPPLVEEIQQTRPFASPSEEGVVALLRTADRLRRSLSLVVEGREITLQQYNVLRILRGAGASGLPTLEIGERMIEQAPGVTRLVDRLERKSLVRRERCPSDRRQVTCRITAGGLRALGALQRPMASAAERLLRPLGAARIRELIALLDVGRGARAPREGKAPPNRGTNKEKMIHER